MSSIPPITAVVVFVVACIFKKRYVRNEKLIASINNYFDALGLGVFTIAGAKICIDSGHTAVLPVLVMAMISSTGGSMIRDFALNEIPLFLRKRIYIIASLCGASLYYLLYMTLSLNETLSMIFGAGIIFIIRMLATVFKLNIPKAINFSEIKDDCEGDTSHDESDTSEKS
jgi:uncharacterized membrane protein YeiH